MKFKRETKMSSLQKGILLLSLIAEKPYKFSLSQLANSSGINRSTVYRILTTLEESGMVIKDEKTRIYRMGPMTYHMGNVYLFNANYRDSILTILNRISEESAESVGIAHREGNQVVSLYEVETHQVLKINDKPGTFYEINRGCYGKCLMAFHDPVVVEKLLDTTLFEKINPNVMVDKQSILAEYARIRDQGYVESIDEEAAYVVGVGVPLHSLDGSVQYVLAVSFFRQEDYRQKLERMRSILLKYQKDLEKYLI